MRSLLSRTLIPRRVYQAAYTSNSRAFATLVRDTMSDKETAEVLSSEILNSSDAKWVRLKKINWKDPEGKERVWEASERTTTAKGGVDAVAILAMIRSEANAFPPCTVVVTQFRPPIGKYTVEMPAGLIDEGETPEETAIRELHEETGFNATKILDTSSFLVCDPGMTTATMKLVVVDVPLKDKLEIPEQKLDAGEFVKVHLVELPKLVHQLKEFEAKGYVIDARLAHFAHGFELAERMKDAKK